MLHVVVTRRVRWQCRNVNSVSTDDNTLESQKKKLTQNIIQHSICHFIIKMSISNSYIYCKNDYFWMFVDNQHSLCSCLCICVRCSHNSCKFTTCINIFLSPTALAERCCSIFCSIHDACTWHTTHTYLMRAFSVSCLTQCHDTLFNTAVFLRFKWNRVNTPDNGELVTRWQTEHRILLSILMVNFKFGYKSHISNPKKKTQYSVLIFQCKI